MRTLLAVLCLTLVAAGAEAQVIGYGVAGPERTQEGSEHVRWIQDCLNRAMSAQLPVDGVMTPAARSLVRSFQRQQGLTASGIVGPDTEEALKKALRATRRRQPTAAQATLATLATLARAASGKRRPPLRSRARCARSPQERHVRSTRTRADSRTRSTT